jgi:hypothetical protein
MQVTMKSYGVRHDEIAMIELDGGRRGTCHWPLAARAWPLAAPALPAEVLLRLTVSKAGPTLGTTLLTVVIVLLIGSVPGWPYSREWGYGPSGSIGLTLMILIALWLVGQRRQRQHHNAVVATAWRGDHCQCDLVRAVNRR